MNRILEDELKKISELILDINGDDSTWEEKAKDEDFDGSGIA